MNPRTQSSFILIGTLLIGVVIGGLAVGALQHQKSHHFKDMPPDHRFHRAMERIIQPTPKQKEIIKNLLQNHFEQISAIRRKHEDEIISVYDTMRSVLDSVLTKKQQKRLSQHLKRGPRNILKFRLAHLAENLALTREQQAQIDILIQETFDLKKEDGERSPLQHKGMRHLMTKVNEDLKNILTEEQYRKYRRMRHSKQHPNLIEPPKGGHFGGPHPPKRE